MTAQFPSSVTICASVVNTAFDSAHWNCIALAFSLITKRSVPR